ncbi:hypothetical protein F5Y19DRAFT_493199 [Xylariaceae sp. FL1651]|nr:hypothetical protein F5Y19DRAFT_493199 [Xylariaceae sp. FL1651]
MSPEQEETSPSNAEFWSVFATGFPRIPSVDELICRLITINYSEGVITDRHGKQLAFARNSQTVKEEVSATIRAAFEQERGFLTEQLRRHRITTPYAWGLRLSNNVAMTEAKKEVSKAIDDGGIVRLDEVYWSAYRRMKYSGPKNSHNID